MRRFFLVFWLVVILLLAAVVAIGWYFSNSILLPKPYGLMPEFKISEVGNGTVTLPLPKNKHQFANTRNAGVVNLLWEGGYGLLGDIVSETGEQVTRELSNVIGRLPVAGEEARLDTFIFRRNPQEDHGIAYEAITLKGEVGDLQSWWIAQDAETAVLMLNGRRRGDIQESLRIMPTVVGMGYSVLALAYRNHGQSAMSPDGFYHYGASEWRDVVTGLEFLQSKGIKRVVLYGFSMGGLVALETLEHYPASEVPQPIALITDAPLLDPRAVFRLGAQNMGLPLSDQLTDFSLLIARLRSGTNWQNLDQRLTADKVTIPVLLIAGTADTTIPIALADGFAARVKDIEYRRLEGVEHVEAWNQNPLAYQGWIRNFLQKVAPLAQVQN